MITRPIVLGHSRKTFKKPALYLNISRYYLGHFTMNDVLLQVLAIRQGIVSSARI